MALKSWQTNKKNNTPQKKGHGKEKQTAKVTANEKQAPHTEPRPEPAVPPETLTPTLVTTEHAEPYAREEPAGEIHEPTETDGAAAKTLDLPTEEVEIEPVAPEAEQAAPASEPAVEAPTTELTTTAQTEPIQSSAVQPEATATASGTEAETMAAPEETHVSREVQAPEETHASALAEPDPVEPAPAEPAPAEPAPIMEVAVATEQPAAAPEPTPSGSTDAGSMPTHASKEAQPRGRNPRLPPAGTVLQRRDRHGNVRCECAVEQDGIRYAGKLYKSLSSAAIAATKDMDLKSKTQNGHTFWGVAKPARPVRDTLESLERAWECYRQHAEAVAAQSDADEEERARVRQAIEQHAETLARLRDRVA